MVSPIRVSIGTEPKQYIPSEVLKSSILRRSSRPVEFTESCCDGVWHPVTGDAPKTKRGTAFSDWRWFVPSVYQHAGRAIYLDADQVVLSDIAELWDSLPHTKWIAAVRNAEGFFGKKVPEKRKWQTSVMVMNCCECTWHPGLLINTVNRGEIKYADYMQAKWIDDECLHELDPAWNHFGICNERTRLLHWSHVATQPYRNPQHPTANIFRQELLASVDAGHVQRDRITEEVSRGHLSPEWLIP